jgi:hypothetical protein
MVEPEHQPFIPNHQDLVEIANRMSMRLNKPMPPFYPSHIRLTDLKQD